MTVLQRHCRGKAPRPLIRCLLFTVICNGNVNNAGCPSVGGWFICIGTAFFVFNFAISWGPVCWIYPAEIFPLGVRAPAVALSTAANWAMGAVMTEVVKLFPSLNINGVFFLFAGLKQPKSSSFVEIKSPQQVLE
ncbi:unnamed protein product [Peronospora destructor]|uniref:Hexose transporter 1 n=1 Tax=Peronospora destructor TaxID=86335 RepID=A0AAV0TVQ1_9STRA|nr:unnamed protein product [Peronospora destructor]